MLTAISHPNHLCKRLAKAAAITAIALMSFSTLAAEGGYSTEKTAVPLEQQYWGHKTPQMNTQSQIIDVRKGKTGNWVTLEGSLISKTGDEQYRLRDFSGEMEVRIPQQAWQGYHFDAVDVVRITGRVSGAGDTATVDVARVDKP